MDNPSTNYQGLSNLAPSIPQQEPQVKPDLKGSKFAGMISQGYSNELIKEIISPQSRVEHLVFKLAGKRYNLETKRWEVDDDKRLFNEVCESFLIGQLNALLSTDTIMTRIDDENFINYLVERFMAGIIIDFSLHVEKYGISSQSQLYVLIETLGTVIYTNLRRGYMQGERKLIGQSYEQKLTQIQAPPQNKKGFFQGLLGKK